MRVHNEPNFEQPQTRETLRKRGKNRNINKKVKREAGREKNDECNKWYDKKNIKRKPVTNRNDWT